MIARPTDSDICSTYSRDVSVVMGKPSDEAKRLMGALVQMKPKPHDEMEVGKTTVKKKTSPVRRLPSIPLSPHTPDDAIICSVDAAIQLT